MDNLCDSFQINFKKSNRSARWRKWRKKKEMKKRKTEMLHQATKCKKKKKQSFGSRVSKPSFVVAWIIIKKRHVRAQARLLQAMSKCARERHGSLYYQKYTSEIFLFYCYTQKSLFFHFRLDFYLFRRPRALKIFFFSIFI